MYGFITISGQVYALAAPAGAAFVMAGGIHYPVRAPQTADERAAARRADRDRRDEQPRGEIHRLTDNDIAGLMARKIAARARDGGAVQFDDMLQAGIPKDRIEANRELAFARARRLEPKLDAMVAQL